MDQALMLLQDKGILQPILFRIRSQYFVKADSTAISIPDCSCFSEAMEFAFMCFFVFMVEYPAELKLVYVFIERLMDIKSVTKSSTIIDFMRRLKHVESSHSAIESD